ncbi:hypothetical protein LCL96_14600 [Rossellomorea aquimaris]|uniref:hypothetical protein n=1 Tax=Rossellomorea aquimaris TaxID=189382 RepID=UPI001CD460BB|nr:hypothetical protein [Rossellomorea aquimaris]MCA1060165.1 hypothetical protein [Rossellomorea aquimaris]
MNVNRKNAWVSAILVKDIPSYVIVKSWKRNVNQVQSNAHRKLKDLIFVEKKRK